MMGDIDSKYIELRELCRTRHRIVEKSTVVKNQIRRSLDIIWPNYDSLLSDPFSSSSLALLRKYSVPGKISKASFDEVYNLLRAASASQISMLRAQEIYQYANDVLTVPEIENIIRLEMKTLISELDLLTKHKLKLERRIDTIIRKMNTKLTSVPGISIVLAGIIIGEIGDVRRFSSCKKLIAYAGLDPSTKQSGSWECSSGKISKRGSPLLRHALYLAAGVARQCDSSFEAYFKKKIAQGKHFNVAMIATAAKMARVVFYVLKEKKEYKRIDVDK